MDVPLESLAVLNQLEPACSIVDLTRRSTFALTDLVNSNFYSAAKEARKLISVERAHQ